MLYYAIASLHYPVITGSSSLLVEPFRAVLAGAPEDGRPTIAIPYSACAFSCAEGALWHVVRLALFGQVRSVDRTWKIPPQRSLAGLIRPEPAGIQ